jgi:hypothetical protein
MNPKLLPTVMVALSLGSSIGYLLEKIYAKV